MRPRRGVDGDGGRAAQAARRGDALVLADPNLYWLVFNGTVRIYEVVRADAPRARGRRDRAAAWCALCLEERAAAATALPSGASRSPSPSACYEATGQRRQAAAAHALEQLAAQRALDRHNPVPPKKLVARYGGAERKLRALKLKYEWLGGGGGGGGGATPPPPDKGKRVARRARRRPTRRRRSSCVESRSRASEAMRSRSSPRCSKRCKTMRRRSPRLKRRPRSAPPS